jgi:hypothetical protein
MSRYATLDPILISSASDKRKAPSLIAPPAVKKKITSKKLLIQVRIPALLNIMPFFTLTILFLHDFRLEHSNQWLSQILPMLHQLVRFSPSYSLFIFFIGIHLLLASCRRNFDRSSRGKLFSTSGSSPGFTKNSTGLSSTRGLSFTRSSSFPSASYTRALY